MSLLEHPVRTPLDRSEWRTSDVRRIVVELEDGDIVQVGITQNSYGALALARSIVSEIEDPQGEWLLAGDRFLRPGAIVSVDVLATG